MNRVLGGSIVKLNIQRAFFLTFLSKIVALLPVLIFVFSARSYWNPA